MHYTKYALLVTTGSFLALVSWACGDDSNNGTGGTAATSSSSSSTTTSPATSSTTNGGCEGVLDFGQDCTPCLEQSCCGLLAACATDPDCYDCLTGTGDPGVCQRNTASAELFDCATNQCNMQCFPPPVLDCNPVTSLPCDVAAGASCDTDGANGFICWADGNVKNLCEACGSNNEFCRAGMTCLNSTCMKYCCGDGDCGTGRCETGYFANPDAPVGVCITVDSDPTDPLPACDAPADSPSCGACVAIGQSGNCGAGGAGGSGTGGAGGAGTGGSGTGGTGGTGG